jgi:hypothetical protein
METYDFRRVLQSISDLEWRDCLLEEYDNWLRGVESNHHRQINSLQLDPPATSEQEGIVLRLQHFGQQSRYLLGC